VTGADRRLAALAALFAPEDASALLAGLGEPFADDVARRVARLAEAPRQERLAALGAALASDGPDPAGAAGGERPRVAAALRRVASGSATEARALRRLVAERVARLVSADDRARGGRRSGP
jgi:hypothetical protein